MFEFVVVAIDRTSMILVPYVYGTFSTRSKAEAWSEGKFNLPQYDVSVVRIKSI